MTESTRAQGLDENVIGTKIDDVGHITETVQCDAQLAARVNFTPCEPPHDLYPEAESFHFRYLRFLPRPVNSEHISRDELLVAVETQSNLDQETIKLIGTLFLEYWKLVQMLVLARKCQSAVIEFRKSAGEIWQPVGTPDASRLESVGIDAEKIMQQEQLLTDRMQVIITQLSDLGVRYVDGPSLQTTYTGDHLIDDKDVNSPMYHAYEAAKETLSLVRSHVKNSASTRHTVFGTYKATVRR